MIVTSEFLEPGDGVQNTVLLVLNYTLPKLTPEVWRSAKMRVCADGGANRLYDELPALLGEEPARVRAASVPDFIRGDLDSVRDEVRDFYAGLGAKVERERDQDTTDFQKCMAFIEQAFSEEEKSQLKVLVVGFRGGRLDHELSNLNTLHLFPALRAVLLSDASLATLLPAGRHTIRPHASLEGPHCGLVPLGAPCTVTTAGLRWNLESTRMEFGALVSSSNEIVDYGGVSVETDSALLWTTDISAVSPDAEPAPG